MTALEAFVWCFGILVAGITIRYSIEAFGKAVRTIKASQEEVKKNVSENDSQGE